MNLTHGSESRHAQSSGHRRRPNGKEVMMTDTVQAAVRSEMPYASGYGDDVVGFF